MKNTIKIKCPLCDELLIITIDENLEIISIEKNTIVETSEEVISELLHNHGIEFG
jgi:phage FluMu protein Com